MYRAYSDEVINKDEDANESDKVQMIWLAVSEQLDQKQVYIKQIIKDEHSLFRTFSDALSFTQCHYKLYQNKLIEYIKDNPNVRIGS